MMATQKEVFLAGEGDARFERNRLALRSGSPVRDKPLDMFAPHLAPGDAVLEIGCADGSNLAALSARCGVIGHGVDPSEKAIRAGKEKYPGLNLYTGTADSLPFPDGKFRLVWFGFCLYLLDRSLLMRAIAEADRVCGEDGYVAVTDFDPPLPRRRDYHHRPGVYTWKMDYSQLLLANPAYVLVEKVSYSHQGQCFELDPKERIATWLLKKTLVGAYALEEPDV